MSRQSLVCDPSTGRVFMVPEGEVPPEHTHIATGPRGPLAAIVAEHLPPDGVLAECASAETSDAKLAALYKWAAKALERQVAEARPMPPAAAAKILKSQAAYQRKCGDMGEPQSIITEAMARVAKTRGMRGAFGAVLNALASNAGCLVANGEGVEVDFEAMLSFALESWRRDLVALKSGKPPENAFMEVVHQGDPLDAMAPMGSA